MVRQGNLGRMDPRANLERQVTLVPLEIPAKEVTLDFLARLDPMGSQDQRGLKAPRDPRGHLETLARLANQVCDLIHY